MDNEWAVKKCIGCYNNDDCENDEKQCAAFTTEPVQSGLCQLNLAYTMLTVDRIRFSTNYKVLCIYHLNDGVCEQTENDLCSQCTFRY